MMAVWPGEMVAQVVKVVRLEVYFPRTTRGSWDVRDGGKQASKICASGRVEKPLT